MMGDGGDNDLIFSFVLQGLCGQFNDHKIKIEISN